MESNTGNRITQEDLIQRQRQVEKGALIPQILITVAVSFGSFSFGNIIGWGGPALQHLEELEYSVFRPSTDFAWLVTLAPLGATIGILPWAFLTKRIGPKSTLLYQAPLLLLCWFLKAYYKSYKIYCTAHFFSGFFAVCYAYSGELYLIETVHRYYMKTLFACFRSAFILGFLCMDIITTFANRMWLCIICAAMTVICCGIMIALPDSPVFLAQHSGKAEKSLRFYTGQQGVAKELNIIRQHVVCLTYGSYNHSHLLSVKVVVKTIFIVIILQVISTMTGYYAFLLDKVRILSKTSTVSPYVDNIIFGVVLFTARLIAMNVHLRIPFGVKKPLIISAFMITVILFSFGTISFIYRAKRDETCVMLVALCLYAISYEVGLSICPEIILYDYTPYQVYDYIMKMLMMLHWFMVFATICLYMIGEHFLGLHWTLLIMACLAAAGFVFIIIYVIESKGKTLLAIQMKLGGNPAGNRGSRRQRIANPFEHDNDNDYIQRLIHENLPETST